MPAHADLNDREPLFGFPAAGNKYPRFHFKGIFADAEPVNEELFCSVPGEGTGESYIYLNGSTNTLIGVASTTYIFLQRPASDNLGAVLFLEVNRPREYEHMDRGAPFGLPPWRNRPVSRAHELAREVGRMFGGADADVDDEDPSEKSLMAIDAERMRGVFNDLTLSKIRKQTNP